MVQARVHQSTSIILGVGGQARVVICWTRARLLSPVAASASFAAAHLCPALFNHPSALSSLLSLSLSGFLLLHLPRFLSPPTHHHLLHHHHACY